MDAQTHTPKPWRTAPAADGTIRILGTHPDGMMEEIARTEPLLAESRANAWLISAAPDLLAACLAYRDARDADDFGTTAARRGLLLSAIAKATGGQL